MSERERLKREILQLAEEPTTFDRLYRHIFTPVAIVIVTFYSVTAVCYLLGEGVIWLVRAVIGK